MFVHIRDNKTFGCLTVRHGTAAKETAHFPSEISKTSIWAM